MLKMFNDANTTLCNKHRYIDYKHVNFQKWSMTHRVLKSRRSKLSLIHEIVKEHSLQFTTMIL